MSDAVILSACRFWDRVGRPRWLAHAIVGAVCASWLWRPFLAFRASVLSVEPVRRYFWRRALRRWRAARRAG